MSTPPWCPIGGGGEGNSLFCFGYLFVKFLECSETREFVEKHFFYTFSLKLGMGRAGIFPAYFDKKKNSFICNFIKYMAYIHISRKNENMSTPPCCPIGGGGGQGSGRSFFMLLRRANAIKVWANAIIFRKQRNYCCCLSIFSLNNV